MNNHTNSSLPIIGNYDNNFTNNNMIIENENYNLKNLKFIKIKEKTQKKSFTDCANYLLEVFRNRIFKHYKFF
jgi:hypothetical protein